MSSTPAVQVDIPAGYVPLNAFVWLNETSSSDERAALERALDVIKIPWELGRKGSTPGYVCFLVDFVDDALPNGHLDEAAATTYEYRTTADTRQPAVLGRIRVNRSTLAVDEQFANDVIAHEMGHVLYEQTALIIGREGLLSVVNQIFGSSDGDFDPPGDDDHEWRAATREAIAEAFKDVFVDKANRKYDNRTKWPILTTPLSSGSALMPFMLVVLVVAGQALYVNSPFTVVNDRTLDVTYAEGTTMRYTWPADAGLPPGPDPEPVQPTSVGGYKSGWRRL